MPSVQADSYSNAAGNDAPVASFGWKLPTTGGTAATLDFYETYTYSIQNADLGVNTGSGTFSSTSGTLRVTRVGKLVTVTLDAFTTTTASNVSGIQLLSNAALPARFLPANQMQLGTFNVGVGGTGVFWRMTIETSGAITLATRDNTGANTVIANAAYTIGFSGSYTL